MWKMDLRKRETKLLHKMGSGWADMEMDKEGKKSFRIRFRLHAENGFER